MAMKRLMKMSATLVATMCMAVSCGLQEIGGNTSGDTQGGVWGGPIEDNDGAGAIKQTCYMTALDYQKGYDWRSDQARESVRCSLVVYADGRQIMKVPVGEEYETGSDPDMHRMIGGHLYTDYSTSDEMVIKKDGVQIIRYPGRETMCGMTVSGGDVYTLGQNRSGEGFAFRRNGEILLSREHGSIMGTLRQENDSISFAFSENITSSEGRIERYYAARNGKVSQIALRDDIRKVWDVLCCRDSEIYAATLVGVTHPVLFKDGRMSVISLPKNSTLLSLALSGTPESLTAEIMYLSGTGIYCMFWKNGSPLVTFPKGCTISSRTDQDDMVCCALNPSIPASTGLIYRCGEFYDMPKGFSCIGGNAICMIDGILNIGLSSYESGAPVVWKDGEMEELKINGYIASISAL